MSSLTAYNYLNLVGYIINAFVTFAASPIFGFPDNGTLSDKYQSIITPDGFTFIIWGVIFISQAIFAIAQMFARYRGEELVQEGVSFWYFVACICQSAWTFAFGYEVIPLSSVFMAGILVSLIMIVIEQSNIESDNRIEDFWILKFPFSVHCGWIFAAFAANINVTVVSFDASEGIQKGFGYLTLVYLAVVAAFGLVILDPSDYTIPCVLVWTTIGIISELGNPLQKIKDKFGEEFIGRFRMIVIGVCVILAGTTAGFVIAAYV